MDHVVVFFFLLFAGRERGEVGAAAVAIFVFPPVSLFSPRMFSRLRGFKRRNFFFNDERSTLQRPGNESISKYIFAVSSSTWLASIVRETFNEQ